MKKYKKGAKITNIHQLVDLILREKTIFMGGRPVHFGYVSNMSFVTLRGAINRGAFEAVEK